ncbi:MAG: hypothetical protein ACR2P3_10960 [Geminicoccaceae bacterium]
MVSKEHYGFLDNSVPAGERPRTVSFGWYEDMTILDIKGTIDIDRYKRIDIDANHPIKSIGTRWT